jgi:Bardet-Biedl syndrome 5 protein
MEKNLTYEDYYIWQDREIRFDILRTQLSFRQGEKAYDTIANVEDAKGNNGDVGTLIFTNLRLIWYCQDNIKINLSIGYDCVLNFDIKSISSKTERDAKALAMKCKFSNNRYEFIFNSISDNSPNLFSSFQSIFNSYDKSRMYRDIKMKGFLTNDKNIITLTGEKILNKYPSVTSLTNDQAVIGALILTNIRILWYSNNIDTFNLSLPWIQIKSIKIKELTKNGKVISVETGKGIVSNNFNFKFSENVETILRDIENYYKESVENPIFGEDLTSINKNPNDLNSDKSKIEKEMKEFNKVISSTIKDDFEIIDTNYFNDQANMLYYMISNQDKKNSVTDIVYSYDLGLAIEKLPENITLDSLWKIIPS